METKFKKGDWLVHKDSVSKKPLLVKIEGTNNLYKSSYHNNVFYLFDDGHYYDVDYVQQYFRLATKIEVLLYCPITQKKSQNTP